MVAIRGYPITILKEQLYLYSKDGGENCSMVMSDIRKSIIVNIIHRVVKYSSYQEYSVFPVTVLYLWLIKGVICFI